MLTIKKTIPALCLAASLAGLAAHAADTASSAASPPAAPGGWQHHRAHGLLFALHELNLSPDQKAQVKSIFAGERSRFEALRASARANRQALATTAPTDPGYPALIQTAQANAATRIQLESEAWSAIYSNVLDKPQQQAIPGIAAAAEQARAARAAEWRAQHAAGAAVTED